MATFDLSSYGLQGDSSHLGGLWIVPGTDIYVRQMGGLAAAQVGVKGSATTRNFATIEGAIDATRQLNSAGLTTARNEQEQRKVGGFFASNQDYIVGLPAANRYTGSQANYDELAKMVPPPHPDASNQSLGPNLGGADGVVLASDIMPSGTGSGGGGLGGLLLLGGAVALAVVLLGRK